MHTGATHGGETRGGAWGVTFIGATLAVTAIGYAVRSVPTAGLYPLFDAGVLFVLGGTVAAAGYWLGVSDVDGPEVQRIAIAVGLGVIGASALMGWQLLAQVRQGAGVREPLVVLALTGTVGAVCGLLVGFYHVRSVRHAREAEEARAAAREARASTEQLRFFTHLLRHHLCNGVQVIRSHAQFLTDHVDEDGETHVDTIRRRSDRLVDVVENMRVLTASSTGDLSLESVDLVASVEREVAAVGRTHQNVSLTASIPDETIEVTAGPLLGAVCETVLVNAIDRASIDHPTVAVAIEATESHGVVTITAPGPERDEDIGTLIERAELRRAAGEQQLDFYVTKRLVGEYGGEFTVDDDSEETRFDIAIPLAD
jgi:signal transduction histidine kinase